MANSAPRTMAALVYTMRAHEHRTSGTSILGIYISRPAGRRIAAVAYCLGLSPNVLTMLSVVLSIVAAIMLQFTEVLPILAVVVVVLLVFAEFLDYADGDLARVLEHSSPLGEWLDHTVDPAKRVIEAGALAATLSNGAHAQWAPLVVTYFLAVVLTTYTAGVLFVKLVKMHSDVLAKATAATPPMSFVKRLASTSFLALADPLLVAFGAFLVLNDDALFMYLVFLAVSNTVVMLALTTKWSRKLCLASAHVPLFTTQSTDS